MRPTIHTLGSIALAAGLAGGCASYPDQVDSLEEARASVQAVSNVPEVSQVAQDDLEQARQALRQAEEAFEERESIELIRHHAYRAERHAQIVRERLDRREARERLADLEDERQRLVLQSREREAMRNEARAERLARESEAYRQEAAAAQRQAAAAEEQARELRDELQAMEAEKTTRGWLLTLDDVLFATGEARLQAGTRQTLQRLADFLQEHSERRLLIEGHTDSSGPEELNERLSRERAHAVEDALVSMGVNRSRLRAVGMGEDYPVASNDSATGRQQNRRVEIVFSGQDGEFPEARQETTALR